MTDWNDPKVLGMVVLMLVLAIVPVFTIRTVEPFFLGVPFWAWIMFVIHAVLLGLVVKFTETLGVIEGNKEVSGDG